MKNLILALSVFQADTSDQTLVLEHVFRAAVRPVLSERPGSLELVLDLGAFRDSLVESDQLRLQRTSFGTFLLDLMAVQLFDFVIQLSETMGLLPATFAGDEAAGLGRTIRYFGDHGAAAFRVDSFSWRDSNFGSHINTIHGVPHFLATSWFIARGYHPLIAALAGMINNVLLHEMMFEAWEPLSAWDVVVNSLGAISAAIPSVGNEVTWNPVTGCVVNRIYSDLGAGHRALVSLEQLHDYGDRPLAERPVIPVDVGLGYELDSRWGRVGVTYRMLTDATNTSDPLTAFDPLRRFEVMATFSIPSSGL
jgi:hypothetical protein